MARRDLGSSYMRCAALPKYALRCGRCAVYIKTVTVAHDNAYEYHRKYLPRHTRFHCYPTLDRSRGERSCGVNEPSQHTICTYLLGTGLDHRHEDARPSMTLRSMSLGRHSPGRSEQPRHDELPTVNSEVSFRFCS